MAGHLGLTLAYVLENTGVGAYNGAGPALKNKQLLAAAGSIVQVEARHAAAIALLSNEAITPNGGFDKPLSKAQVPAKAGPLIKKAWANRPRSVRRGPRETSRGVALVILAQPGTE